MATVLNQAQYLGALANPEQLKHFISQMITEGGRGITGENDVGFSSLPQIYADLANRGIDLSGLPTLQEIVADPVKYKGIGASGAPTLDNPTQPPKADAPPAPPAAKDGKDALGALLTGMGLGDLTDQAWAMQTSGASWEQIHAWLKTTSEYQTKFAGLLALDKKGMPITEAQSLALESEYGQIAHQYGLLPGSYDAQKAIAGQVSATEFSQRAADASAAIFNEPQQVRDKLLEYNGLTQGQIASWYLNPDNAEPQLQNMLHAAEIGGTGAQLGIGIGKNLAEQVAQAGFTGQSARAGLAQVAANSQLYDESISERNNLTAQDAVAGAFGLDAQAALALKNRQQERAAIGQGGGGGIVTNSGVLGERVAQ